MMKSWERKEEVNNPTWGGGLSQEEVQESLLKPLPPHYYLGEVDELYCT
jgi:hypothetical protein